MGLFGRLDLTFEKISPGCKVPMVADAVGPPQWAVCLEELCDHFPFVSEALMHAVHVHNCAGRRGGCCSCGSAVLTIVL
jgi:hypothetical protein